MKANRRGFLGLLGIGAVSAPLAAKAAAESEMMKLSSIHSGILSSGIEASSAPPMASAEFVSPYIQANNYLKLWGKLPEFVDKELRNRANSVHYLDPDIVCKRSWSLNVKIQAQKERNYHKEIERYRHSGNYAAAQSAFRKLTGWEWPW